MEMIRTKFVPPLKPNGIIGRSRLRDRLQQIERYRTTLVCAPAGYGKTALLTQWFGDLKFRDAVAGWVTLDERERVGGRLLGCVAAMMGRDPRTGIDLDSFLREQARWDIDRQIGELTARLASAPVPVYLFFDDVHLAGREAAGTLQQLIRSAPCNTRIVLASRGYGHLEVAAMRAYCELHEVTVADLRFTHQEASALLSAPGRRKLAPSDVAALISQTEGWVTGLSLASWSMTRDQDRKVVVEGFSGRRRAVSDFFEETVLRMLSEDVRSFLQRTSVLDRLDPEISDLLTCRNDSSAMLRRLEESGQFVFHDDERDGYRYPQFFSVFLRRRFAETDSAGFRDCHVRAARIFAARRQFVEALTHAREAKNDELLAEVLEMAAEPLTFIGKLKVVADHVGELPERLLARCPYTALAAAWLHIRGLRFDQARRLIDLACGHLALLRADEAAEPEKIRRLTRAIRHREMMLAAARDDVVTAEEHCIDLMRDAQDDHPFIVSTVFGQLAASRREQFRFEDLEKLHVQGRATAEQSGYRFALVSLQAAVGVSLFAAGRTEAAEAALRAGLEEGVSWAGPSSGLAAIAALPLAEIAYEQNDLDAATSYVETYMPVARELCFVDQLVAGHLVSARLHAARGDTAGAERALDAAMDVAHECELERLRLVMVNEQVRMLVRNGLPEVAARCASRAGIEDASSLSPHARATTKDELRALIWSRIAISQNRLTEVLALARHWRAFCAQRGATRSLVRWNLQMSQVMMVGGDNCAAQRTMREAIAAAAPARLVRSFVDEGPAVLAILAEAYADAPPVAHPSDVFAGRILEAFHWKRPADSVASPEGGLYGRLTSKELEILRLVGCGMRNREIGIRIGLTEGSVKWYMQQVYDKVGVRRRSQAVERARQFGLIPDSRPSPIWR